MAENKTHSNFYGSPCYLQERGRSIKKMNVLEWSQPSPIVSLSRFFYDAKGKLTPQSKVGFTLN